MSQPGHSDGPLSDSDLAGLAAAGISLEGSPGDPTGEKAVALGTLHVAQFHADALTIPEVAALLGESERTVEQWIADGLLATLEEAGYRSLLPRWQFVDARALRGLGAVLHAADAAGHSLANFMTRPDPDLVIDGTPVSPVAWLEAGRPVRDVAQLVAGLGTWS